MNRFSQRRCDREVPKHQQRHANGVSEHSDEQPNSFVPTSYSIFHAVPLAALAVEPAATNSVFPMVIVVPYRFEATTSHSITFPAIQKRDRWAYAHLSQADQASAVNPSTYRHRTVAYPRSPIVPQRQEAGGEQARRRNSGNPGIPSVCRGPAMHKFGRH